jgi:hypothetical protein
VGFGLVINSILSYGSNFFRFSGLRLVCSPYADKRRTILAKVAGIASERVTLITLDKILCSVFLHGARSIICTIEVRLPTLFCLYALPVAWVEGYLSGFGVGLSFAFPVSLVHFDQYWLLNGLRTKMSSPAMFAREYKKRGNQEWN